MDPLGLRESRDTPRTPRCGSAAGVIFNFFRRRETRNIFLSSTSTTSHVIVDMLSKIIDCVLRDTIRDDDNMEIDDDQEVLPCYPPLTSSLLLMSLRHCAWIGMMKRDEMFERRSGGGDAMNERKHKGKVKVVYCSRR